MRQPSPRRSTRLFELVRIGVDHRHALGAKVLSAANVEFDEERRRTRGGRCWPTYPRCL
jgi:hypothetical protein